MTFLVRKISMNHCKSFHEVHYISPTPTYPAMWGHVFVFLVCFFLGGWCPSITQGQIRLGIQKRPQKCEGDQPRRWIQCWGHYMTPTQRMHFKKGNPKQNNIITGAGRKHHNKKTNSQWKLHQQHSTRMSLLKSACCLCWFFNQHLSLQTLPDFFPAWLVRFTVLHKELGPESLMVPRVRVVGLGWIWLGNNLGWIENLGNRINTLLTWCETLPLW